MPIFHGTHEFVSVGELKLGGINVQEVYLGSTLIWPTGVVVDGGLVLYEEGCRVLQESGAADFILLEIGEPIPIASPEAQSVLDRMCGLDAAETTAIINIVDCMVANGLWDKVLNMWGLGLNALDHLTAWKDDEGPGQTGPLIPGGTPPPSHLPAEHRTLFATGQYYRTTNTLDQMLVHGSHGFFVYHDGWTGADGNFPTDLFGAIDVSGNAYQCRWLGNVIREYDLELGSDGPLPRPVLDPTPGNPEANRFGEDNTGGGKNQGVLGGWHDSSEDSVLIRLDDQRSAARGIGTMPAVQFQAPGTNNNGDPVALGAADQYVALWVLLSHASISNADVSALRNCMLQFARDLGLTDVPAA